MAQALSGRMAFIFGFKTGRRTKRLWSAREALEAYSPSIDTSNVDCFLNGADDAVMGDAWRYNQIRQTAA